MLDFFSWLGGRKVLKRREVFCRMIMLHQNLFSWWEERGLTMLSDLFYWWEIREVMFLINFFS